MHPDSTPPPDLQDLVHKLQSARDELLQAALLLREHLFETDEFLRQQARERTDATIRRAQSD